MTGSETHNNRSQQNGDLSELRARRRLIVPSSAPEECTNQVWSVEPYEVLKHSRAAAETSGGSLKRSARKREQRPPTFALPVS